jgi:hypothetical protein
MADAAIATALEELVRVAGEAAALSLVERMRERLVAGEFDPVTSVH